MPAQDTQPAQDRETGPILAAVVAAVAMLFLGVIFAVSGLVMPPWAVAGLLILWILLVWYGLRLARAGTYRVLVIPLVAAAVWLLVVWLGDVLLGWTA